MWVQKKTHRDAFKKVTPKLRGTGDIDALLNQSNSNDVLEKEAALEKERDNSGSSCGCGW
jgi:hypothetical protein